MLLSHREPKTFALMFDGGEGGERRSVGDGARAVGKRAEASKTEFVWGPSARATRGKIVDALGEARDGSAMVTGTEDSSKMMREPPSVEDRKPITTPLVTGIKAVDLLAPVGRGQCMLVSGEPGTGLSELGLTSIVAQKNTGVRCVYAALGAQASRVDEVAKRLEGDGAMSHTTIVTVMMTRARPSATRPRARRSPSRRARAPRAKTSSWCSTISPAWSTSPRIWRAWRRS